MAERSSRWITVHRPFDYRWPGRTAITSFGFKDLGEHLVKDELADWAVRIGCATEGKLDGLARSRKGGTKRVRRSRKKEQPAAKAADAGSSAPVGDADAADADRPADRPAVDQPAG